MILMVVVVLVVVTRSCSRRPPLVVFTLSVLPWVASVSKGGSKRLQWATRVASDGQKGSWRNDDDKIILFFSASRSLSVELCQRMTQTHHVWRTRVLLLLLLLLMPLPLFPAKSSGVSPRKMARGQSKAKLVLLQFCFTAIQRSVRVTPRTADVTLACIRTCQG